MTQIWFSLNKCLCSTKEFLVIRKRWLEFRTGERQWNSSRACFSVPALATVWVGRSPITARRELLAMVSLGIQKAQGSLSEHLDLANKCQCEDIKDGVGR